MAELQTLSAELNDTFAPSWQALIKSLANCHEETQELVHSILIELYPELVDELAEQMSADEQMDLEPDMRLSGLLMLIEENYRWAISAESRD